MLSHLDWQALGTWFTGIAIAIFAFLTWRLSKRQQQLLYSPKLVGYNRYDYPKVGAGILVKKHRLTTVHYDGIRWEVVISNPGSIPIPITDTTIRVKGSETGEKLLISPGPYCKVFSNIAKSLTEAKPRFTVPAGKTFVRTIIIYDSEFTRMLQPTLCSGGERKVSLEIKFFGSVGGVANDTILTSSEFSLPTDTPFGKREKTMLT